MCLNGLGTSAYQAVIQLSIFDTFFAHERGRALSYYLFGQQLGSILGLITGGSIEDGPGWRWSQYIVAIIDAGVLVLLALTFEETLFPRFLFSRQINDLPVHATKDNPATLKSASREVDTDKHDISGPALAIIPSNTGSTTVPNRDYPKRTFLQPLKPGSSTLKTEQAIGSTSAGPSCSSPSPTWSSQASSSPSAAQPASSLSTPSPRS